MKVGRLQKPLMPFDWSFIFPPPSSIVVFFVPWVQQTSANAHLMPPSLKYPQAHADHSPVKATHSPLTISVFPSSVCLALLLHHAMKDTGPLEMLSLRKEVSWSPPPSYCFFITYYLCLTDLLQTNGCHMERERLRKGKEGKTLSTSSSSPWPSESL